MRHSDGRLPGANRRSLYYQYWQPEAVPRAVLLVVHGAGEHSTRYRELALYFTGHLYAVASFDLNGHGHSDGIPGHVHSFEDYLAELHTFHQKVSTDFAGVPLFLLGHSMGGLIASLYLLQRQDDFNGAILSGAAIKAPQQPPAVQLLLVRLLAVLAPRFGVLQLAASGVSRDPQVVAAYQQDAQVLHGKMSARMVRELFAAMHKIQAQAANIHLPILVLHGGTDVLTAVEGSRLLCDRARSADKTLKIYPELFHEVFNEPERLTVLADVLRWCEARLGRPAQ